MKNIKRFNEANDEDDDEDRYVQDGVWDLEDIEVINAGYPSKKTELDKFKEKYPNYATAEPYDTQGRILLSKKPTKKVKYTDFASSFEGHGSCAMIENCPKRILILGQAD